MNQQTHSKILPILVLLTVGIISYCTTVGNTTPPDITPGELLIRLTPEAFSDLHRLKSKSPIEALSIM